MGRGPAEATPSGVNEDAASTALQWTSRQPDRHRHLDGRREVLHLGVARQDLDPVVGHRPQGHAHALFSEDGDVGVRQVVRRDAVVEAAEEGEVPGQLQLDGGAEKGQLDMGMPDL